MGQLTMIPICGSSEINQLCRLGLGNKKSFQINFKFISSKNTICTKNWNSHRDITSCYIMLRCHSRSHRDITSCYIMLRCHSRSHRGITSCYIMLRCHSRSHRGITSCYIMLRCHSRSHPHPSHYIRIIYSKLPASSTS